ncbi:hypothetical protein H9P43_007616 [Blastocladiella emersonii ATCC 22665]|nr:hypothetical protein H9P43_007616 [Blastocladiella emersonii ATCC 22665]
MSAGLSRTAGFYAAVLAGSGLRTAPAIVHAPRNLAAASPGRARVVIPIPEPAPARPAAAPPSSNDADLGFTDPRPMLPEAPDNCCMSGCINCVWNLYMDDFLLQSRSLRAWHAKRHAWAAAELARGAGDTAKLSAVLAESAAKMVPPASPDAERAAALAAMDPTVRVFWELEQQVNNKKS